MDLLKSDIKKTYLRYLITSFGSAIITSIYGLVDMAMIGQYYGPKGSSAMAVVAPVWNLIYSLGLLVGIGGSIVYSHTHILKDLFAIPRNKIPLLLYQ